VNRLLLISQYDVFLSPAPASGSLQVTNLAGHPAIALESGFIDNMPQAIMVTGRLYDEATVCRVIQPFNNTHGITEPRKHGALR
jgi:Asp-tRNA(Asn)/Glu-tRNA(Gln) amidotransferase A subunit family amidase